MDVCHSECEYLSTKRNVAAEAGNTGLLILIFYLEVKRGTSGLIGRRHRLSFHLVILMLFRLSGDSENNSTPRCSGSNCGEEADEMYRRAVAAAEEGGRKE